MASMSHVTAAANQRLAQPCSLRWPNSSKYTALVISSNFGRISISSRFRDRLSTQKNYSLFSPPHLCLTPPLRGTRHNFWIKFISQKLEGYGLLCGESCMIPTSTVFDWSTRVTDRGTLNLREWTMRHHVTDGRTDGRAIAYSALCISLLWAKNYVIDADNKI